jgi:hypothetical protein
MLDIYDLEVGDMFFDSTNHELKIYEVLEMLEVISGDANRGASIFDGVRMRVRKQSGEEVTRVFNTRSATRKMYPLNNDTLRDFYEECIGRREYLERELASMQETMNSIRCCMRLGENDDRH